MIDTQRYAWWCRILEHLIEIRVIALTYCQQHLYQCLALVLVQSRSQCLPLQIPSHPNNLQSSTGVHVMHSWLSAPWFDTLHFHFFTRTLWSRSSPMPVKNRLEIPEAAAAAFGRTWLAVRIVAMRVNESMFVCVYICWVVLNVLVEFIMSTQKSSIFVFLSTKRVNTSLAEGFGFQSLLEFRLLISKCTSNIKVITFNLQPCHRIFNLFSLHLTATVMVGTQAVTHCAIHERTNTKIANFDKYRMKRHLLL